MELQPLDAQMNAFTDAAVRVTQIQSRKCHCRIFHQGRGPTQDQPLQRITENYRNESSGNAPTGPTRPQKRLAYIQISALCWMLLLGRWNDGTTGTLLPRIQEVYGVKYAIVSLIFIFAFVGFTGGALSNIYLTDKMGFGKTIVLGSVFQVVGYCIQAAAPPLPAFVVGYLLNGVGLALQDAQAFGFVGILSRSPTTKMGVLHAAYGIGALAAPLSATQFVQLPHWSFHYLISVGIAMSNTILLASVFKFKTQDESFALAGGVIPERTANSESERGLFKTIMRTKAVHLLAIFILIYVGVEVTIGGWIVTYIKVARGGGPSSGYISSGFFAGLTAGRVSLLWVNKKVGERRVLFIYTGAAIVLDIIIWFVPSLIGSAVAVAFIGVLLGPMFPIAMNQASQILPRWILTPSIGWIAGFGQAGSALLPFLTGAISEKHGIASLQPLLVSMMACMMVLWTLVPNSSQRFD